MFYKLIVLLFVVSFPTSEQICFPNAEQMKIEEKKGSPNAIVGAFSENIEKAINKQIRNELSAHYAYLSMSYHFDQSEYYLPGFSKFFKKMSEEEHEHAQKFMKYLNKRGGKINLHSIHEPCQDGKWGNGTMAMKSALGLEKLIYGSLIELDTIGNKNNDPQFVDYLESEFLAEQVDSIKQISDYVNVLERLNSPLGEYQFDKLTLGGDKE